MIIGRILGSWPAIAAVPIFCLAAQQLGIKESLVTYTLSILALTLSQLIIREQTRDAEIDKDIQLQQLNIEKKIERQV